jgi:hypothetical protein
MSLVQAATVVPRETDARMRSSPPRARRGPDLADRVVQ